MGKVIAYHPTILIRKSDTVYRLGITCDDWYDDERILHTLARITGAVTIGDIVDTVANGEVMGGIIIDAHLVDDGGQLSDDADNVYDYYQLVG